MRTRPWRPLGLDPAQTLGSWLHYRRSGDAPGMNRTSDTRFRKLRHVFRPISRKCLAESQESLEILLESPVIAPRLRPLEAAGDRWR